MRAGAWSQSVDIPTLAYQKPDAYPRHVEAVEPSLDVEPNLLGFLMPLPLEYALGDSRYCGVMTSLDGIERLCETPVVVVNLWWPFGIRNPCIIPASISYFSIQRLMSPYRFSMGIRSLLGLVVPLQSRPRLYVLSLIDGFGIETGSAMSPWFNA
jgi:hypothetical protein